MMHATATSLALFTLLAPAGPALAVCPTAQGDARGDAGPPRPGQGSAADAGASEAAPAPPGSLRLVRAGRAAGTEPGETVTIELVDTLRGTFGDDGPPRTITATVGGDPVAIPMGPAPLDLRVAAEDADRWAVSFLHGPRAPLDAADTDLFGRAFDTLAPGGEFVAVVVETGVVVVEVVGADEGERFVATFIDERPEPGLHRPVRVARPFEGPVGAVRVPPGRGRLHIAREGALGGFLCGARGPLVVAVRSGATTSLRVEMVDGPRSVVMAPFESIPFEVLEALAPDGETVIAEFAFESSPLRLPSALPRVPGSEVDGATLARMTRFRQLVRGRGVPLEREAPEVLDGAAPPEFRLATAPLDLTFSVEYSGKVRLPEVDGGWIAFARSGVAGMEPLGGRVPGVGAERVAPGRVRLPGESDGEARLRVLGEDGAPLPHAEVVVGGPGGRPGDTVRAITDAGGALVLLGLGEAPRTAAVLGSPGARAEVRRGEATTLSTGPAPVAVGGLWEGAEPGITLALLERDPAAQSARDPFGSAGFRIAVTDARGRFDFGAAAPGSYRLQVLGGGAAAVEVPAEGARLVVTGTPDAPAARAE